MKKLVVSFLVVAALFSSHCTKQVAGPQGDPGTPGQPGNLSQSIINSLKIPSSSWSFKNNQWEFLIFVDALTTDVLQKGEVQVFLEKESKWYALPYGGEKYIFTQYSLEQGVVHLVCTHVHGGTPSRPADANYRVVIFSPAK